MTLRTVLILCALMLALPMLRLGELVAAQTGPDAVSSCPLEDDDDAPLVEKAAQPARFAFASRVTVVVVPPPLDERPTSPRYSAPPESRGDNGCGAVLRC